MIFILVQYIFQFDARFIFDFFCISFWISIYQRSDFKIYSHDFLRAIYVYSLSDLCIRIVMDFIVSGINNALINDKQFLIRTLRAIFVRLATLFKACSRKNGSLAGGRYSSECNFLPITEARSIE